MAGRRAVKRDEWLTGDGVMDEGRGRIKQFDILFLKREAGAAGVPLPQEASDYCKRRRRRQTQTTAPGGVVSKLVNRGTLDPVEVNANRIFCGVRRQDAVGAV